MFWTNYIGQSHRYRPIYVTYQIYRLTGPFFPIYCNYGKTNALTVSNASLVRDEISETSSKPPKLEHAHCSALHRIQKQSGSSIPRDLDIRIGCSSFAIVVSVRCLAGLVFLNER